MGGSGSGRRSIKAEAIYCLLGVQMDIQKLIYEGIDDSKITREEIKQMMVDSVKKIKVTQEEIERF